MNTLELLNNEKERLELLIKEKEKQQQEKGIEKLYKLLGIEKENEKIKIDFWWSEFNIKLFDDKENYIKLSIKRDWNYDENDCKKYFVKIIIDYFELKEHDIRGETFITLYKTLLDNFNALNELFDNETSEYINACEQLNDINKSISDLKQAERTRLVEQFRLDFDRCICLLNKNDKISIGTIKMSEIEKVDNETLKAKRPKGRGYGMKKSKDILYYNSIAERFISAVKYYKNEQECCKRYNRELYEWQKPIWLEEYIPNSFDNYNRLCFETMEELTNYLKERATKKEVK